MNKLPTIEEAYTVGCAIAETEYREKTAFLGGVANAGKFLLGMGNLGAKGSAMSRISAHHVGMPLGFGLLGAATAEEGKGVEGFTKGLVGGLAFNMAMPLGASIGKRIFAPGFSGKGTSTIMSGLGFSDDAVKQMSASQALNKPLQDSALRPFRKSVQRSLDSGTASSGQIKALGKNFSSSTSNLNLTGELLEQQQKLQQLFNRRFLTPAQQAELKGLYSKFSSGLYKGGYNTGTAGQKAALKGIRFSKGLGTMAGGMGLGMAASHQVEGMLDSHPASVFDASGGH